MEALFQKCLLSSPLMMSFYRIPPRYALYMATLGNRPDLFPSSPYVGKYTSKPPRRICTFRSAKMGYHATQQNF